MSTYTMIEKQNSGSHRDGVKIFANNLTDAKRKATRKQCFEGTYLELNDEHGRTVAAKQRNGQWIDQSDFA